MKTSEHFFGDRFSTIILRKRVVKFLLWGCIVFLFLLLILELQEIMLVQVWRHDALYYLGNYTGKLKAEGCWINYSRFGFLKTFPAHASALLSVSFFGGFVWIAANKVLSWEKTLLVTLLFLQINPLWSVIHWPAVILPAHFFLFFCAYLSRKYRYEYILAIACILFHGTFNNLYNLLPLLFLNEIKTGRQLFRFFAFWLLFYVFGFAVAQFMTYFITGQFIQPAAWREPHYITSFSVFFQNLKIMSKTLVSHIYIFRLANCMLCILAAILCLCKKHLNVYQVMLLFCVGIACYVQAMPLGVLVDLRTVYSLYVALLLPFCLLLLCKRFRIFVLVAILFLSIQMFADNYDALRYYNGVCSFWVEHLRTIPNDLRLNNRLIFLADAKETSAVEQYLMKTMNFRNRIIEGLDDPMRWATSAKSLGYRVIHIYGKQSINSIKPKWLDKCEFHSNQLYEWASYNGTIVVRFNHEFIKRIGNKISKRQSYPGRVSRITGL